MSTRDWRRVDVLFWLPFNIGRSILEEYNVRPIDYYKMVKEYDNKVETFNVTCTGSYAYYDKSGDVIKIYNPKNSKRKFYLLKFLSLNKYDHSHQNYMLYWIDQNDPWRESNP